MRDLRLGFLLKVLVLRRMGRSPAPLAVAQRRVLGPALEHLTGAGREGDDVDRWRCHGAAAAASFLDDLAGEQEG